MQRIVTMRFVSAALLAASAATLIGLQQKPLGWVLLALTTLNLLLGPKKFAKDAALIVISLGILGLTPINAQLSYEHILTMGAGTALALIVPYAIRYFIYKEPLPRLRIAPKNGWSRKMIWYVVAWSLLAYLLLPLYFHQTGMHTNWPADNADIILRLFVCIALLGTWDELFFVVTVPNLLRPHLPFFVANTVMAVLFSSFLYALGFGAWGFIITFVLAFSQGIAYKKTKAIGFVLTNHLTVDAVLFLALLAAHYPSALPIFIT